MTNAIAVDTSVAVPFVVDKHAAHPVVRARLSDRTPVLVGHTIAETYSVLTRLPGDLRLLPANAARLIDARFAERRVLSATTAARLPSTLAEIGIAGGTVYDAMVALAALEHGLALATRDGRALPIYRDIGVRVELWV